MCFVGEIVLTVKRACSIATRPGDWRQPAAATRKQSTSSLALTAYIANSNKKAIIRQKRPIASDKANPRMAYEKSWAFIEGFLATLIMRLPNTVPIPAPASTNINL